MLKRVLSLFVAMTFVAGFVQAAVHDLPGRHITPPELADPVLISCDLQTVDEFGILRGGGDPSGEGGDNCFDIEWLTEDCCGEFVLLGVVGSIIGAWPAVLLSGVAWYVNCTDR